MHPSRCAERVYSVITRDPEGKLYRKLPGDFRGSIQNHPTVGLNKQTLDADFTPDGVRREVEPHHWVMSYKTQPTNGWSKVIPADKNLSNSWVPVTAAGAILPASFDLTKDPIAVYQLDQQYWHSLVLNHAAVRDGGTEIFRDE